MADFLTPLVVLLLCTWVASRYIRRFGSEERSLLWVSLFAHQVAGLVNIWVTKYYYTWGDMMSYYWFGVEAADRLRVDFFGLAPGLAGLIIHRPGPVPIPLETFANASGSMQGISAFAMFFLFDSLYAVCALIAGVAFLSKLALYSVVCEELPDLPRRPLIIACTLLPSALFWSCSLLKEPLAMIGALSAIYGWYQLVKGRRRLRSVLLLFVGSFVVIVVKGYIFPALALSAGAWHLTRAVHDRRSDITLKTGHVLIAIGVAVALVVATGALLPRFAPEALGERLAGLQSVGDTVEGGSNYNLGGNSGSAAGQAALAPLGLLTALFRPLLVEVRTPIVLLSALEMTFFVLAAIVVLVRRGIFASVGELFRRPFLSFCAIFVAVFGTCVGLGTTNIGTLSRYRMPLLPFFATLLLSLMSRAPAVARTSRVQTAHRVS